ncbi:MAG: ATP-binding cassette domain-containing protein [Planctomycetota bacterium]
MTTTPDPADGAIGVLTALTRDQPTRDRNAIRRIFSEVSRAWPGDIHRLWWKWLIESCNSLGLRAKTLDCRVSDVLELVRNHAQVVCFTPSSAKGGDRWLAVIEESKGRFEVLLAGTQETTKHLSQRQLERELQNYLLADELRCVVLRPGELSTNIERADETKGLTPFNRLMKLLKPETSDIGMVVLFAFVVSMLMLATPLAVETLVNTVAFGRFLQPIMVLAIILLTFLGFQGLIRALQTYVVEIIQRRMFARIAGDLAYRLPRLEMEGTDGKYTPELVNRFFDVVGVQKVSAQLLLDGIGLVLSTVIGMAVLGFYHPWLLGFDLFLVAAIGFIIMVLGRGAIASAVKESKHKYYMADWLQDIARNPTTFHSEGGDSFALERADALIHDYLIARRKHFWIVMRQVIFALALQAVASTVLLGLGGWLVVAGELTLGQLVAAELIVTVIVGSFAKFGKHMESYYDLLASVDKLGVLFDLPTERKDGMVAFHSETAARVELHAASYKFRGSNRAAVDSVSVEIEPGSAVALLGPTGSGKSVLLDMISGSRPPTSGHVTIDDYDPRDLRPDALRDRVAFARGGELFHATLDDNVHMHRADVTAADVRDVLGDLGLLSTVLRYPEGCSTMLASSGAPLSEGQARLIPLARAAVGRPGLLLVDGILDWLGDARLEQVIEYLKSPEHSWTVIVSTSREDIANRFDQRIELQSFENKAAR